MGAVTFSPDLAHDFSRLKALFSRDRDLEAILAMPKESYTRPADQYYFKWWQVTWVCMTAPLKLIFAVFLEGIAFFLHSISAVNLSKRLYVYCSHCVRDVTKTFDQIAFGKNLLIPSTNEYRQDLTDIYTLPSIARSGLKDQKIKEQLNPILNRVNFDRIRKGLCHGAVNWFNALVLSGIANEKILATFSLKDYLCAVAKRFENGQPRQAALLQTFNKCDDLLLEINTTELRKFPSAERSNLCKFCFEKELTNGIYHLFLPIRSAEFGHAVSFIKCESECYIWNPNAGLIQVGNAKELNEALPELSSDRNANVLLSIQLLTQKSPPSLFSRLRACAFPSKMT